MRLALVLVLATGGGAWAQGLEVQRFVPAAGAAGGLQVERPVVPAHLGHGVGLFLNFARDTIPGGQWAGRSLGADLLASLGLFDVAEIALHLPLQLMYRPASTLDGEPADTADGLNGLRLVPKLGAGWIGSERLGLAFGFAAPITLPFDSDNGAYGASIEPRLLVMGYGPRWSLSGSGGYRVRRGQLAADELTFGLAATLTPPIAEDALDVEVEVVGARLIHGFARGVPIEALAALVYRPRVRWSLYAGAGAGLTDGPAIPDLRVLAGLRYAVGVPERGRPHDADNDGVADHLDRCRREPEDLDGFEDEDGCPEEDNDRDGVADDDDECPDDAEEPGADGDGCPDRPRVVVRRGKMVVYGKVLFPLESADLLPGSEPLIDEMARALEEHPGIRRLEIEGHTDDTGPGEYNLELSQQRAEVVKRALERRQVASQRLVPRGYGEQRPVAPNVTRAGRAKNRRVEFTILQN